MGWGGVGGVESEIGRFNKIFVKQQATECSVKKDNIPLSFNRILKLNVLQKEMVKFLILKYPFQNVLVYNHHSCSKRSSRPLKNLPFRVGILFQ